jgi:hypothetical protein
MDRVPPSTIYSLVGTPLLVVGGSVEEPANGVLAQAMLSGAQPQFKFHGGRPTFFNSR